MTANGNATPEFSGATGERSNTSTFTFGGAPKRSAYVAIALGALLGPMLWGIAIYTVATGDGTGSAATTSQWLAATITFGVGLLLGLPAYLTLFRWKKLTRYMHLEAERAHLRYWDGQRVVFTLPWNEIAQVSLKIQPSRTADNIEQPVLYRADRTLSAIDVHPALPEHFQRAHPEMKRFQKLSGDGIYRVHLGLGFERAEQADTFLRQQAPALYTGREKVKNLVLG